MQNEPVLGAKYILFHYKVILLVENAEEIEEQAIFEEYKIWKKNSPFLYDTMYSHALTWPSLSVEWLPNRDVPLSSDCSIQKLLMGTHTSNDEQNYIQIMKVKVPLESSKDSRDYMDQSRDVVGFGGNSAANQ